MVAKLRNPKLQQPKELWSSTYNSVNTWTQDKFTIPKGKTQVIQFENQLLNDGYLLDSGFEIKSVMITDGICNQEIKCDFNEKNYCDLDFKSPFDLPKDKRFSTVDFLVHITIFCCS